MRQPPAENRDIHAVLCDTWLLFLTQWMSFQCTVLMMFCCVYKLWLWAFDMHGLFQTQFTSAERPFATRQVSTLGATFHGGLRPRYVQSRAAGPTKSHFFLQRHAALSETRGRCSW